MQATDRFWRSKAVFASRYGVLTDGPKAQRTRLRNREKPILLRSEEAWSIEMRPYLGKVRQSCHLWVTQDSVLRVHYLDKILAQWLC